MKDPILEKISNNPFLFAELFFKKKKGLHENPFKNFTGSKQIKLSKNRPPETTLEAAMSSRVSSRSYTNNPLHLDDLGTLLYFGAQHRSYPSAGAKYPLEIYVLSQNTALPKGIYHYNLMSHSLEKIIKLKKFNISRFIPQKDFYNVPCFLIITGVFARETEKYNGRGYRYVFIEAGHMVQNFYLLAGAMNLGGCAIGGGFYDDRINKLLKVDGKTESVIYIFTLGHI